MSKHDPIIFYRHMLEYARILWQIVTQDLPPLIEALEAIIPPE